MILLAFSSFSSRWLKGENWNTQKPFVILDSVTFNFLRFFLWRNFANLLSWLALWALMGMRLNGSRTVDFILCVCSDQERKLTAAFLFWSFARISLPLTNSSWNFIFSLSSSSEWLDLCSNVAFLLRTKKHWINLCSDGDDQTEMKLFLNIHWNMLFADSTPCLCFSLALKLAIFAGQWIY